MNSLGSSAGTYTTRNPTPKTLQTLNSKPMIAYAGFKVILSPVYVIIIP